MTDYARMILSSIVMHQILRSEDDATARFATRLTDEPVVMNEQDKAFLTRRFKTALSGRGIPINEDHSGAAVVPSSLRTIWSPDADFVVESKTMANHLASVQPGSALEGLLVVAEATVDGDELVLVAKVEHQEAMRIEPMVNAAGHNVFEIERLNDLVFGDLARIYKIAILSRAASSQGMISGELVDEQNGRGIAAYFLAKFMGMQLREEPAVLTERFLERMTKAINESTLAPDQKLDAQSALVAELRSNASSIEPERFISRHIPQGHGSEIRSLAQEVSTPMARFPKDTSLVASRLSRLRIDLDGDVVILTPPDSVGPGQSVEIDTEPGSENQVTVRGRLRTIRPSGGNR